MRKIAALLCLTVLSVGLFAGCNTGETQETTPVVTTTVTEADVTTTQETEEDNTSQETESTTSENGESLSVNIGALKGPTAMGMVSLMRDADADAIPGYDYNFAISAAIDEVTPAIVQGKLDIAAIPANLASVLYNNTNGEIRVLAINTLGVLYIVESGETIQSVEDLRGKTIYASGKGATPEYALNYILAENGIDPETDVNIEWKSEHAECAAALAASENGIAMLPQPFVTTAQSKNENIRIALDLTKEWDTIQETIDVKSTLVTGVIVARRSFIEENPAAVSDFLDYYAASVDYTHTDIEGSAALIEAYDIIPAAVAEKALPYCNITFIEGQEMTSLLSGYLRVLFDRNPQAMGGEMPSDEFYYQR